MAGRGIRAGAASVRMPLGKSRSLLYFPYIGYKKSALSIFSGFDGKEAKPLR
jgi:hypothetical protein